MEKEKSIQEQKSKEGDGDDALAFYTKTKNLVNNANSTFQILCKTLENEQQKLKELEIKRKSLQEQMFKLKQEIADEKSRYETDLNSAINRNEELEKMMPESVDVTNFSVQLKSDVMRDILAKKTLQLKEEMLALKEHMKQQSDEEDVTTKKEPDSANSRSITPESSLSKTDDTESNSIEYTTTNYSTPSDN